eukprot:gene10160-18827_t
MVFTEEELRVWKVEDLKKYLSDRGVPLNTKNCRKPQLIEKVIFAEKLELPTLPSQAVRKSEIDLNRSKILFVDGVQLPFPETIGSHWLEGTLVVPQTRISDAPYTVWVSLRTDASSILASECGCVAGYSNSCKHVFALLYYILAEVRLGNNRSCTGKKQQWSVRTYKKNEKIHEPSQMSSVKILHHHPENDDCIQTPSRSEYEPRSIQDLNVAFTKADWEAVAEATDGKASVLQFVKTTTKSSSKSSSQTVLPPSTLPEIASKCQADSFHAALKLHRSAAELKRINAITADQASSEKWFQYRHGVITASSAHEVLVKVDDNHQILNLSSSQNLCAKICMYNPSVHSASLNWGKNNEKFAFKRYTRKNRTKHKHFSSKTTGLFISEQLPFLGASPDGVISCKCCGFGVLEIKCPWKSRDLNIADYLMQPESCLSKNADEIFLKPAHKYYTQVQHQMFVTGAEYCDFEVFLPKESLTVRIPRNPQYEIKQVPKLVHFFKSIVLPELFSGTIENVVACRNVMKGLLRKVEDRLDSEEAQKELQKLDSRLLLI